VYGNQGIDYLYGDFFLGGDFEADGGDDIIYTGEGTAADYGSWAIGGVGDDKIYGQGAGDDFLIGGWDDDKIWGGDGDDHLFGDDASELE